MRRSALTVALLLSLAPARAAAQALTVTLLGTGAPVPSVERFGPATLVRAGGQNLLFDCGRGATQRLRQAGVPLGEVTALFLTHLHSDHVVGIPDLWLTGWLRGGFGHRAGSFAVWGPPGTRAMMAGLEQAYQEDVRIRTEDAKLSREGVAIDARDIGQGVVYRRSGVTVTAFTVDHGKAVRYALGYRVDYRGHAVVISGDTRYNTNLIHFAKGTDVLIHEVAMGRGPGLLTSPTTRPILGHHTSPEEAGKVFAQVRPRLAVYTHIVLISPDSSVAPPTVADLVAHTRTTYAGPLEVGEDLMTIAVGDSVEVRRPH
ncbi:MAG TPA: MBL fold metallo-hydrolase [Gemmatimonadales bacterium]|nr:MBL fold metallo-hydrolase [Gemmatimonadales bacterium]